MERITVNAGQLQVHGRRVPLLSGEVQFWRMDPDTWAPALRAVADSAIPIVATYLSWRRHEPAPGELDLDGRRDERLNVRRFLTLCAQQDLLVHLKPGPWICAEEPGGGYPDWLMADRELWSLKADGSPVSGYNPPFKHPVPSYLHPRYLGAARSWLQAVDHALADFFYPRGPIVLMQLDNEPSYCFQDDMYGADYHPVAIGAFRRWLLRRYRSLSAIERAWDQRLGGADAVEPPRFPAPEPLVVGSGAWRRNHDWIEFKEWLLAEHLDRLRRYHVAAGAGSVLFTVNYNTHPIHTVPQSPRRIQAAIKGVGGEDLYYIPPLGREHLAQLARTAAFARSDGEAIPWAPEIQAGIWRSPGEQVDYPNPTPSEQRLYYMAGLAFGLKGFNLYMLAGRENWELAPLNADGSPGPMLSAVRHATSAIAHLSDSGFPPPVTPVAVLWHRPHARDAYAGTLHTAYERWVDTFDTLVRSGHTPALWDTVQATPPVGTESVVVPSGAYLPAVWQRRLVRLAAEGVRVVVVGEPPQWSQDGQPCDILAKAMAAGRPRLMAVTGTAELPAALTAAGIRPPVVCSDPQVHAVLQQGEGGMTLFVLRPGPGSGKVELRLAGIATAELVPLVPAHGASVPVAQGVAVVEAGPWAADLYRVRPQV